MNTKLQHPPMRRVLRTALQVLVAIVVIAPSIVNVLELLGHEVNGRAIEAIAGVAVLVATTVVNTWEKAGSAPIIRTLVQIVIAVVAIVPAAVALLDEGGIDINEAQLAVLTGAAVLVATTVQNLLEGKGVIPTFLAGGPPCIGCGPVAPHGENPELIDDGEVR